MQAKLIYYETRGLFSSSLSRAVVASLCDPASDIPGRDRCDLPVAQMTRVASSFHIRATISAAGLSFGAVLKSALLSMSLGHSAMIG